MMPFFFQLALFHLELFFSFLSRIGRVLFLCETVPGFNNELTNEEQTHWKKVQSS